VRTAAQLDIKLTYLKANIKKIQSLVGDRQILFMVKANGYGHGMVAVTRYAAEECGIKQFGVATLEEAIHLRQSIRDQQFDIYVFSENYFSGAQSEPYSQLALIPVLSDESELDQFLSSPNFKHVPLVLKWNTGMNRLGLNPKRGLEIINKLKKSNRTTIYHFMTHLARSCESVQKVPMNGQQLHELNGLKKLFIDNGIVIERDSIANSGAIEQKFGMDCSYVRPGLLMYGPTSLIPSIRSQETWSGECLSALKVKVLRKFKLKAGDPVGYGASLLPYDSTIVILAIGYGDGFSTKLQNCQLKHLPGMPIIFGRINMDMTQLLYHQQSEGEAPKVGEWVEIWGHNPQNILNLSDQSGIIPYELFCNLNNRVPRIYSF